MYFVKQSSNIKFTLLFIREYQLLALESLIY